MFKCPESCAQKATQLRIPGATFEADVLAKSYYEILTPLSNGINTFEFLAARVGATWSFKSRPIGARGGLHSRERGTKSELEDVWNSVDIEWNRGGLDLQTIKPTTHMVIYIYIKLQT